MGTSSDYRAPMTVALAKGVDEFLQAQVRSGDKPTTPLTKSDFNGIRERVRSGENIH